MIEIPPGQVTANFKALYDPGMPTYVRCLAVLGGGNAGRIFTDDLQHPSLGYAWERDDGSLYCGGQPDPGALAEMVQRLRQEGIVILCYRDGDTNVASFPPDPQVGAECIELLRPAWGSDLTPHLALPAGYTVHRMGRELLEKSPRLDESLFRYGTLENYLDKGLDVCILHGDEFVCEAGADMDVGGVREAGIVTERPYRGKGFATIATAHLLQWCDELGCATYWDVNWLNTASIRIARRLGYRDERRYRLVGWWKHGEVSG